MIEILLKLPFSALINIAKFVFDRPRLKLECWFSWHPNKDEIGNSLVFWIKVINPTKDSIYFERLEAVDSKNKIFFPMILGGNVEREISPRRNIIILIPYGHIANTIPKEVSIVDATEKYHKLKGRKLARAVDELKKEVNRLKALGIQV